MSEYRGTLEIDHKRGMIYFHLHPDEAEKLVRANRLWAITLLRICGLPTIPKDRVLDITHMVGCDWREP
jgi:hypothetical protein